MVTTYAPILTKKPADVVSSVTPAAMEIEIISKLNEIAKKFVVVYKVSFSS